MNTISLSNNARTHTADTAPTGVWHEGAGPLALVAASGGRLSYRQLDYWCRTSGWINIENDSCGSGSRRVFSQAEWDAVLAMLDELDALQARFERVQSGAYFAEKVKEATQ